MFEKTKWKTPIGFGRMAATVCYLSRFAFFRKDVTNDDAIGTDENGSSLCHE